MAANSGPTSSGAMPNFMVGRTSSLIKLVLATIKFDGLCTRGRGNRFNVFQEGTKIREEICQTLLNF